MGEYRLGCDNNGETGLGGIADALVGGEFLEIKHRPSKTPSWKLAKECIFFIDKGESEWE